MAATANTRTLTLGWSAESPIRRIVSFLLAALLGATVLTAFELHETTTPAQAVTATCATGMTAQNGLTATPSHGQVLYIDSGATPKIDAGYVGYQIANSSGSTKSVWTSLDSFTGGKVQLANPLDQYQQLPGIATGTSQTAFYLLKALGSTTSPQTHTLKVFDRRPDLFGAVPLLTCNFTFAKVAETIKAKANKVTKVTTGFSGGGTSPELGGTVTVSIAAGDANTGTIGSGSSPDGAIFWASPAAQSTWPTQALRLESTTISIGCKQSISANPVVLTNKLFLQGADLTSNCTGGLKQDWTATYTFRVIGPGPSVSPVPVAVISSGTQYKHSDPTLATTQAIDLTGVSPSVQSVNVNAAFDSNPDATHARILYTVTVSSTSTAATGVAVDELVSTHSNGGVYVSSTTNSGLVTPSTAGPEPLTLASEQSLNPPPYHFVGPFKGIKSGSSYKVTYKVDIPCDGSTSTAQVAAYVGTVQIAKDATSASGISITADAGSTCSNPNITPITVSLKPTAATTSQSGVTSSTATLNGNFNASGNTGVTYSFLYGTDPNLAGATNTTWTAITGSTIASNSASISVSAATTYYFQAQIKTSGGQIYSGTILNFTSIDNPKAPTVNTNVASAVTTNAATLNGLINPNGTAIASVWFTYSTTSTTTSGKLSSSPTEFQVQVDDGTGNGKTPLVFSSNVFGGYNINSDDALSGSQLSFSSSTVYYFQIRITCTSDTTYCPGGNIYGSVLSFKTGSPTATTASATMVGATIATLNGSVTSPSGATTTIQFCYSDAATMSTTSIGRLDTCLNSGPTNANTSSAASGVTATTYLDITGLTSGGTYYFQIIGTAPGATTYGAVISFQTLQISTASPLSPGVIGTAYSAFTFAGVGGTLAYSWSKTAGTLPAGLTLNSKGLFSGTPTTAGNFSFTITLTDDSSLLTTTKDFTIRITGAPTVTTTAATSVTATAATMNGSVNPNGATITAASWCWSTSSTLATCTTVNISSTIYSAWNAYSANTVSADLATLANATTYYYSLSVTYGSGTVVTSTPIVAFTTLGAPVVAATGGTSITGTTATLNATVTPSNSAITAAQICFGSTSTTMTDCSSISETYSAWALNSTNNVATRSITGLTAGATYWYSITATNAIGSASTTAISFTTASAATVAANTITSTSALLRGSLTAGSSSIATTDVTSISLCYSSLSTVTNGLLSSSPTCNTVSKTAIAALATGSYSFSATGLTAGATYWSQIKVVFSNSTLVYGSPLSFTTLAAPLVTTDPASAVGINTATLNGVVNAKGSAVTSATFCYGTDPNLATCTSATVTITGWTTSSNVASTVIVGLNALTTYYYKLTAVNGVGTGVSGSPYPSFITLDDPLVQIDAPARVTSRGATLKGLVNPKGAKLKRITFCWSTNSAMTANDCTNTDVAGVSTLSWNGANGFNAVQKDLANLAPGTTYWYIITATAGSGGLSTASFKQIKFNRAAIIYQDPVPADVTVYSNKSSFTTAGATTDPANPIGATTATLNGTLNASSSGLGSSDVSSVIICYSASNSYDANGLLNTNVTCSNSLWNSSSDSIGQSSSKSFSYAVTGLSASTPYYFQIQTTFFDGSTANGTIRSFTTLSPPTAYSAPATSVSQSAALLNGSVDGNGSVLSEIRICYGTAADLTGCTSVTLTAPVGGWTSGLNTISKSLTGLNSSQPYYFRVSGTNAYGTSNSPILSFTTLSILSFDSNGGTSVSAIPHAAGAQITQPTNPTKTGYSFDGWFDSNSNLVTWPFTSGSVDQQLTAHWTATPYAVNFNSHGGSSVTSKTYTIGDSVTKPTDPTYAGYHFDGWFTAATGGSALTWPYSPPATGDITLHAQWTAIQYNVTFDSHLGSAVSPKTYTVGASVTKPTDPTYAGHIFNGWFVNASGGTALTWPYSPPATGDITLHAQWTAVTVTFSKGTGGGTAPPTMSGEITSMPGQTGSTWAMTAPGGYVFAGWACPVGSATIAELAYFAPTANVLCTAVWVPAGSVTVTFNINDPTGVDTTSQATQSNNVQANLSSNIFVVAGYTFSGWNTQADGLGTPYAQNASYSFGSPLILFAQWTANSYSVIYNTQLGSAVANGSYTTGGSVTLPTTAPTRAGYTFSGWFTNSTGGSALGATYAPGTTGSITLYAQWAPDPKTLTFHSNYPSGSNTTTTMSNYVVTQLDPNPFLFDGYTFAGWNTLANGSGTNYSATATYNFLADLHLYAKWTANSYAVVYNTQLGSAVANGSYTTGGSVTLPTTAPIRAGYTFSGWFLNSAGGSALGATYAPGTTGSITLFAQWAPAPNTVIFNSQGGSAIANSSFLTGTAIDGPMTDPTKDGAEFKGWTTTASSSSYLTFPYSPGTIGTVTLYAQWAGWSITFALGNGGGTPATGTAPATLHGVSNLPTSTGMTAPTGYFFAGWQCPIGTTTYPSGTSIIPTGPTVCVAVWSPNTGHTINFHANYPVGISSTTTQTETTSAQLNPNPFQTGGFTFMGWSLTPNGAIAFSDRQVYDFSLDGDLYAIWHLNAPNNPAYEIRFLYRGGSEGITVTYYTIGDPGIGLPEPTKPGYEFQGWTAESESTATVASPFTTSTNVTLYAIWKPKTVTITFNYLGGRTGITSVKYTVGTPGLTLPTSTKSQYDFGGWSLANGGSEGVSQPYAPVDNVTLYAIWDGTTYKVTLVPGYGKPNEVLTYTVGGPGLELPMQNQPNYKFIGWNNKLDAVTPVTVPYKPTSNVTLYTIWKDIPADTKVFFGGDSPVLDSSDKAKLKSLAKIIMKAIQRPQMVVDGWVKQTLNKSYDMTLSAQRAQSTAAYLRSLGVNAVARLTPRGISPENTAYSRRVDIQIFYSGPAKKKP